MPYQFRWTHTVPDGTLPRLRFARVYQMRARVADLAGGGFDVADPRADRCFTDPVTYLRYEPLLSPELGMTADAGALAPGEAVDRVVIAATPIRRRRRSSTISCACWRRRALPSRSPSSTAPSAR